MSKIPFGKASVLELIGRTPLVYLRAPSEKAAANIFGKCEFMNPGLSLKDRTALYIIEEAERSGALRPGGTIVEGTAGNTGIGLAQIAAVKGYKCILVIPNTMAKEKIDIIRGFGAEVRLVEKKPWGDPEHYNSITERLSREIPGAVWANQFHNKANAQAHYETTGPEIWEETGGQVDVFIGGMGTAGTMVGAGRFLREASEMEETRRGTREGRGRTRIIAVDPRGSVYASYFKSCEPVAEGTSIVEGVGIGRVPGNYDGSVLDDVVQVDDADAVRMVHVLTRREGLFVGGCAGLVVAGAVAYARAHPRKDGPLNIVAILSDTGRNYVSKLFNPEWLASQGLPIPD